jgi:hypothetical protein
MILWRGAGKKKKKRKYRASTGRGPKALCGTGQDDKGAMKGPDDDDDGDDATNVHS